MEILMIVLLLVLIVCMIVLIVLLYNQNGNQIQSLLKSQESLSKSESSEKILLNVSDQLQTLRKEQAASYQSMDLMQNSIQRMNQVMTNTKARGNWGEYQLDMLLDIYVSENQEIYETQYTLSNGRIADVILHLPNTEKVLCIDSKFPMENYVRKEEVAFQRNVKKHIDDISNKYIISHETINQALLFVPSEAIYQYICAECDDLLNYALKRHVLFTSPTTLVGILYTLISSTKDFYRASHIEEIEKNILCLQEDIDRLVERSEKAEKSLAALSNHFHQVSISAKKVSQRLENMTYNNEDE